MKNTHTYTHRIQLEMGKTHNGAKKRNSAKAFPASSNATKPTRNQNPKGKKNVSTTTTSRKQDNWKKKTHQKFQPQSEQHFPFLMKKIPIENNSSSRTNSPLLLLLKNGWCVRVCARAFYFYCIKEVHVFIYKMGNEEARKKLVYMNNKRTQNFQLGTEIFLFLCKSWTTIDF